MVFTLHPSRHGNVGGRKQKISHWLLLFAHQQLYIAALLSLCLEIGCKPPIELFTFVVSYHNFGRGKTIGFFRPCDNTFCVSKDTKKQRELCPSLSLMDEQALLIVEHVTRGWRRCTTARRNTPVLWPPNKHLKHWLRIVPKFKLMDEKRI